MPMNAKELKQLYSMTTDAYSEREPFTNTRDNLVQKPTRSMIHTP